MVTRSNPTDLAFGVTARLRGLRALRDEPTSGSKKNQNRASGVQRLRGFQRRSMSRRLVLFEDFAEINSPAKVSLMDSGAKDRAAMRCANAARWPLRVYAIDAEPHRAPLDRSTVDERVATVWPLTREAWAVAGKEIPSYQRSTSPGSMQRRKP